MISSLKKKTLIIFSITLLFMSLLPTPKASANPLLGVAGGIEVGALAFWGGAVLVSAAGVAVGMDKDMMAQVENWGRSVWEGANDAIRSSITSSLSEMRDGYDLTKRFAVTWTPAVLSYLQAKWEEAFGNTTKVQPNGYLQSGISAFPYNWVPAYFTNQGKYFILIESLRYDGSKRLIFNSLEYPFSLAKPVSDAWGLKNRYELSFSNGVTSEKTRQWVDTPCDSVCEAGAMGWSTVQVSHNYTFEINEAEDGRTHNRIVYANFDVFTAFGQRMWTQSTQTFSYPQTFPKDIVLPAPRGDVMPDGKVKYKTPTIGRVGGTTAGDIAVGYPAIPGDATGLKESDKITAGDITVPINPPVSDSWLERLFVPTAINTGVLTNVWTSRFPAIDNIMKAINEVTTLKDGGTCPQWSSNIAGSSYVMVDVCAIPYNWIALAKMFMRITLWSGFAFMVLREFRPKPTLG